MADSLQRIALALARALRPFAQVLDAADDDVAALVADTGYILPSVPPSLSGLKSAAEPLLGSLDSVETELMNLQEGEGSEEDVLQAVALLLVDMLLVTLRLRQLKSGLATELPAAYVAATSIDQDFPTRLAELLSIRAMEQRVPLLTHSLELLGIVEMLPQAADPARHQPEFVLHDIRWERIPKFFQGPPELLREVYGWGTPNLDVTRLFTALDHLTFDLGAPAEVEYPTAAELQALDVAANVNEDDGPESMLIVPVLVTENITVSITLFPLPQANAAEPRGLALSVRVSGRIDETIPLRGPLSLRIKSNVDLQPGAAITIRPDQPIGLVSNLDGGIGSVLRSAGAELRLQYGSELDPEPTTLLSFPAGSRIRAQQVYILAAMQGSSEGVGEFRAETGLIGGEFLVGTGDADSFLSSVLPKEGMSVTFAFSIGWSSTRGLYFMASGGLETTLSLNVSIGPILLQTLHIALAANTEGLDLEASVSATLSIGPLVATVERIGAVANLEFTSGNLGPVDLSFDFKPPNGLGLLVDAGPVVGGGFLTFDFENGRYAGILQLQIYSVSLTAIGLLDTKLPGGKPGFSFLIIITAKFPPIQLGFGFTLNGAGGLAGINRTIVIDALQAGVRSGAVDYLLFPEDPIRDAAIIISDLRTFFPPAEGRYVFGPIALIGYGTPTLLDVELGIIIEVPSPIRLVLLGQLNAFLPQPDAAVVELHIDVLGVIDFGAKRMSIDASLRDSRVAAFSLYGDMAMRLAWGDEPSFALAVGGWNPHFKPPAGFPELRRLTLALGDGDNPRITLQGYFALTSNSVQVGARAELYASKGGFSIIGYIGFDAIFIFDPFSFRTDFSAGVALKRGSSTIASIYLDATLTGTSPFHAWGKASFSVLFFSVSVPFDATFGATKTVAPPKRDPWVLLEPAIREQQNWTAELPPGGYAVVSLRTPAVGAPPVLLDPVGSAALRQKVVPLEFTISKFGEATPLGPDHYTVTQVTVQGTATNAYTDVEDLFARGQFRKLSDHQKLTLPSFEPLVAGIRLSSNSVTLGVPQGRNVVFETTILDSEYETRPQPLYPVRLRHQRAATAIGAAAHSDLSGTGLGKFAPDPRKAAPFTLDGEKYVVATTEGLVPDTNITEATTMGRAYDALEEYLANHPEKRGNYQVVSLDEVTAGV